MNSRAIALGASVIALTLAGGSQASASGLGDLNQDLGVKTQTSAGGPAGSVKAGGNVKVPVDVPSKGSIDKGSIDEAASGLDPSKSHAGATVEAKRKSGDDRSELVLDVNSHKGVSAYVDQRRKGMFELEAGVNGGPRRAGATVDGFARRAGNARFHGGAYAPKVKHGSIRDARELDRKVNGKADRRAVQKAGGQVTRSTGGHKALARLRAIGREVGNPIQLGLGGWLIAMTATGGFGLARLVRRLQHLS